MVSRSIVMLVSAVIAASFFFNFFALADLEAFVPMDEAVAFFEESGQVIPVVPALFLATFAFALMSTMLCLIGYCSRYVTLAIGLMPFATYILSANALGQVGLPFTPITLELSSAGFADLFSRALATFGLGAWMYFGGALALVLLAILDPGKEAEGRSVPVRYLKPGTY